MIICICFATFAPIVSVNYVFTLMIIMTYIKIIQALGIGLLPTVEFEFDINNLHVNNIIVGFLYFLATVIAIGN